MRELVSLLVVLGACEFPRPVSIDDQSMSLRGNVQGMWTGADGVVLRLVADKIDTIFSVASNGAFFWPTELPEGASYIVSIAFNPTMHTCEIASGGRGTFSSMDNTSIEVACAGPSVSIALSAPLPWTFDPIKDIQPTLSASLLLQEVSLTVLDTNSVIASARVESLPVAVGKPSSPLALELGINTILVEITAHGGLSKTYQIVVDRGAMTIDQAMYGKASNTGRDDRFGEAVALSGDTLAVSSMFESSYTMGVNGDQTNNAASHSGAVYVFRRVRGQWSQEAFIKASNTDAGDRFGASIALDGDTLAVGAPGERSKATGINGDQADNSMVQVGAAYVFRRVGSTWVQEAYVKASNTALNAFFGWSVALSGDTLAVGARGDSGGVGAAYIFQRASGSWVQQAYLRPSNPGVCLVFGSSIALSGDSLVVGAPQEASGTTGVNGDQNNNQALFAGAAYVFQRSGSTWSQQAYVKATNTGSADFFGVSVAISGDMIVVGASGESSSSVGINGDQADNSANNAGAVYVLQRFGGTWQHQSYIKASNTDMHDRFGVSIALVGNVLAVGASGENSSAAGIDGNQADNSVIGAGAAYLFQRTGIVWAQRAYVKASNTEPGFFGDNFGASVALSRDSLMIGAVAEDSSATGVNGNQADNGAEASGAVYVFR